MNRLIFWLGVLGVSLLANSVVKGWELADMSGKTAGTRVQTAYTFRASRMVLGSYTIIKQLFN